MTLWKTLVRKRATLKRVGWREGARAQWNRILSRIMAPDSVGKKHEDGLSIRFYRGARFHTPEMFNKMGIETFDVALSLKGNVAVDIGAHVGAYAMRLAQNFRFVYAFEPSPNTFKILKQNIKDNHIQNIEAEQIAISDSSGMKNFRVSDKFLTAGTLEPTHYGWLEFDGAIAVRAESLDNYFKNGIGKIDFVKIDVENHELSVLKGMVGIIKKHRPIMSVEVHKRPTTITNCDCDVCTWLREQGLLVELHGVYTAEVDAHWLIVK